MSFWKMLIQAKGECPVCGGLGDFYRWGFRCANEVCRNYQPYVRKYSEPTHRNPATGGLIPAKCIPIQNPVEIRYRNFANQEKTFIAERSSFRRKSSLHYTRCFTVHVAPTGRMIALRRERVISEPGSDGYRVVEELYSNPTPAQERALRRHVGKTDVSHYIQALRKAYPNWKP